MTCKCVVQSQNTSAIGKFISHTDLIASQPIGEDQSVGCVASTLIFDLGCGHCIGICSTANLCRFCLVYCNCTSEVDGVRQYTW